MNLQKQFLVHKRKLLELLVLLVVDLVLVFLWDLGPLMLLNLGFIWNWSASQELDYVMDNRRYRFSLIKMVYNLNWLVTYPVRRYNLHPALGIVPKSLPAGLFWWTVIRFASSKLPLWPVFLGSFIFELTQLDLLFMRTPQEIPPPPPPV